MATRKTTVTQRFTGDKEGDEGKRRTEVEEEKKMEKEVDEIRERWIEGVDEEEATSVREEEEEGEGKEEEGEGEGEGQVEKQE